MVVAVLDAPDGVLGDVPSDVTVRHRAAGKADVVVAFFSKQAALGRRIPALGRMIFPSGGLWIARPKKTSLLPTDIGEHDVRSVALPLGLVDNKICAIDADWTGVRVVWRRDMRSSL
jgi:hypothetical protein